ncbi:exodeoxyribonuclease I [Thiorhodovibrio frisius]|uniref:Exodeoxyribonuclease I n=1 Tax=Thiorhodovibrio frisius TaxID=631362 RepID=H8YZR5_9GAMM|nr:exodeoxyribonuclease I [Thiorhodovibrio frisius]EIC22192.1 exonuclease I [Thiorhodovibrio frisius]WPL24486.1 Exodeoxyribonuclease I [Thiorhodovibrio frisius]
MPLPETFYWHDYETWGSDPRRDRPCQFAGLRTDAQLNELGPAEPPLVRYCQPADDFLPAPDACLVTGITPQLAAQQGVSETAFAADIQQQFARPGTCSVGYNSIRFDEEVTRSLFYRNFLDPYGHSWRDGTSRWDLIDLVRLAHALRPEGIEWPRHPGGATSFRLEHLTAANGIAHQGAHDALADVRATLALARLLRDAQPRLFHYGLELRDKERVRELLKPGQPVLHVSSRYPAERGCIAPVMVVAPTSAEDRSGVILWDLREDPAELFALEVAEIRERVFTRAEDLPPGIRRLPLKKLRLNASPMVAPLSTLRADAAERWLIDPTQVKQRWQAFHANAEAVARVAERVRAAFARHGLDAAQDPDHALYAGFFPPADQRLMGRVRAMSPAELAGARLKFQDPRLPVLLFRYRARNWPDSLSPTERATWDAWRIRQLADESSGCGPSLRQYRQRIRELRDEHRGNAATEQLLNALENWPREIGVPDSVTRSM